jgi:hypothetical protein
MAWLRITFKCSVGYVVIQKGVIGHQWVRYVILTTNIFQRDTISSWDRPQIVHERRFSVFPFSTLLELVWLCSLSKGLGVVDELLMSLITRTDEIANKLNGKWRCIWVATKANFVSRPLDKCFNVLACSRTNPDLTLCDRQIGVGLEVVIKLFEVDI